MNIVLFGIKGCGKTTFGKLVAKKLGRAFIDTDRLIEETFHTTHRKKLSCRDIYKAIGPVSFRGLEYEVIQSLQDVQQSVIAAGGGAMLLYENVEALQKNSRLIYLFCDREKLRKRVLSEDPLPPFINPNDPDASFDKMYDERNDFYKKLGAIEIDISQMDDNAVIEAISKSIADGKQ